MNVEWLTFSLLSIFFGVVAGIYAFFSGGEPVGTVGLLLSGGFGLIIGYYLWYTARRMEARPEDRADADVSEGSGEIGFFAPHSWWPIMAAGSFATAGLGLAFGWWLFVTGLVMIIVAATGFLLEYYLGVNRTQGQTLSALQAQGESPTSSTKWLAQ